MALWIKCEELTQPCSVISTPRSPLGSPPTPFYLNMINRHIININRLEQRKIQRIPSYPSCHLDHIRLSRVSA